MGPLATHSPERTAALALLLAFGAAGTARAQVVIRPLPPPITVAPAGAPDGLEPAARCAPGERCEAEAILVAPEATVVVSPPVPPRPGEVIVRGASESAGPAGTPIEDPERPPTDPRSPAPGLFALCYLAAWDGEGVLGGGGIRATGHLDDVFFLELTIGGLGRDYEPGRTLLEVPIHLGLRVMGPLVTPILRAYGTLATGITIHGATGEPEIGAWGVLPIELGGGLELGAPVDERFAVGGFVDVRASARVPFERQSASLGVAWSAGLALMWF